MAASSRTVLLLVGVLVASFYVSANAAMDVPALTGGLTQLLTGALGPVPLQLVMDLRKVAVGDAVVLAIPDAVGGPATLALVGGVVTAVQPVSVTITVAYRLSIVVEVMGMKKEVAVPMSALNPVLDAVNNTMKVVLALVPTVVNGVNVVQIASAVGAVVATITGSGAM